MILLGCRNIRYSVGDMDILKDVNIEIKDNEHAALVGVNGAGKSTLFKIINGELRPDEGDVFTSKGLTVGYLEQNALFESENTVWEEALDIFSELTAMEHKIMETEAELSKEKDVKILEELSKKYLTMTEEFKTKGGYEYIKRISGILRGMGFVDSEFDLPVVRLSGGQKTRLAISKLLLTEPDLLLLDEPTNHLDIKTLSWLEGFLKSYKKAFLVVSHDRYFLDVVTTKTIEIEGGSAKSYECNYTEYAARKKKDREVLQKHYEHQQKEIARLEAFIEQQKKWNRERNIIAAESRQKSIDRMEKIDAPTRLPGKIRMSFETAALSGNDVLDVKNLSKQFENKPLFSGISFALVRSQRVFLLGDNGVGKSTLFKMIEGRQEISGGQVKFGTNVSVGYYDQELSDLNDNNTILDEVWEADEKADQTRIRNMLGSFLFLGEDAFKKIGVLSGGEKARVALCKLLLNKPNFLLLDEPTNHLDIEAREVLEDALSEYDGTIFSISHDRYFINKLSTRIIEMKDNGILDFSGNYEDFLRFTNTNDQLEDTEKENKNSISRENYLNEKQKLATERKRQRDLEKTEETIEVLEKKIEDIDREMSKDAVATNAGRLIELTEERNELEKELNDFYEKWEALS